MNRLVAFFIRYPVWTNVLMFSLLGFGYIYYSGMSYSSFPELEPSAISIQVAYPGASPTEVEEGVVLKIEESIDGIEGVERITSVSRENTGAVTVEALEGFDIQKVLTDVKNAVDRINSFPAGSEKPVIFEQRFLGQAVNILLSGNTDLYNLKTIAEAMRDDLLASPEISQIRILGLPRLEFSIEVAEADLRRYGLTFDEIVQAVRRTNINISGGKFDTRDEEILIRAQGRNYTAQELRNIVVRGTPAGTVIYLRDIAQVREKWEDVPDKIYYNGQDAVILDIDKTVDENVLKVVEIASEKADEFNSSQDQVQARLVDDQTVGLRQRLNLLSKNGFIGLLLVTMTLGFFMNLRLAFWVSLGIPISFAGMFIVAGLYGLTINVISTFGMIIVVGILVDDAIVVGENIYAHYERGASAIRAAIDGTREMLAPVFTSVTTTIIAFTPFFFVEGFLGKFIWQMALVVVASLAFSLVEAFLILPAHLAHSKGLHSHAEDPPLRQKIEALIKSFTHKLYAPSLRFAMRHKWVTLTAPIAFFMLTIGLLGGGFIGATFFPFIDVDTLPVNVSLVAGRQENDTNAVLERIESVAWRVNDELKADRPDGKPVILGIQRDIGTNNFGEAGSHVGRLTLYLMPGEERALDSFVIANRIRELAGPIPEAQNATFGNTSFFGKPVSISLLGNDFSELSRARDLLVKELKNFDTLKDITDSSQEGRREIDIRLKPRAYALGLTLSDVAGQVRQGFFGDEVQRVQRGRDEIRVWVRYRPEDRTSLGFLEEMRIRTPDGGAYPFGKLAEYEIKRGLSRIDRLDKRREIKVEANQADVADDLPPILAEIRDEVMPRILAQTPSVNVSFEGQSRDQQKTQQSMNSAFSMAMISMLILVVLVFRSYLQALLVFALIPFGIMGAIWGHGIVGIQLNTLSIYGIIALSGIIINDSIVFVDQINRNLRGRQKVFDAVFNAGLSRLRPILLTTFTTTFGLAPIILETSRQAQFLIPMAVSVAFGLLFGTFILLLVLPAGYMALNRVRMAGARYLRPGTATPELVEPAVREVQSGSQGLLQPGEQTS